MPSNTQVEVSVVIPVYNEEPSSLLEMLEYIPLSWEILVIDDGSEIPIAIPESYAVTIIRHATNQGYGAAIKTGILQAQGTYIITMDGDGQHTLSDAQRLIQFLHYFPHLAMVIGDRRIKETQASRLIGRKLLNWTASLLSGRWIPDLNSGLRVFRKSVALGYLPILCDTFSFTTSLCMSMLTDKHPVDWLPIKVRPRAHGMSHVKLFRHGLITLRYILWIGLALRTRRLRGLIRTLYN